MTQNIAGKKTSSLEGSLDRRTMNRAGSISEISPHHSSAISIYIHSEMASLDGYQNVDYCNQDLIIRKELLLHPG